MCVRACACLGTDICLADRQRGKGEEREALTDERLQVKQDKRDESGKIK